MVQGQPSFVQVSCTLMEQNVYQTHIQSNGQASAINWLCQLTTSAYFKSLICKVSSITELRNHGGNLGTDVLQCLCRFSGQFYVGLDTVTGVGLKKLEEVDKKSSGHHFCGLIDALTLLNEGHLQLENITIHRR